jgi:hypothetical protein
VHVRVQAAGERVGLSGHGCPGGENLADDQGGCRELIQAEAGGSDESSSASSHVAAGRSTAWPDVRPCSVCHGARDVEYAYNLRMMTKPCEACYGQGVIVYHNGVKVKPVIEDAGRFQRPSFCLSDGQRCVVLCLFRCTWAALKCLPSGPPPPLPPCPTARSPALHTVCYFKTATVNKARVHGLCITSVNKYRTLVLVAGTESLS